MLTQPLILTAMERDMAFFQTGLALVLFSLQTVAVALSGLRVPQILFSEELEVEEAQPPYQPA